MSKSSSSSTVNVMMAIEKIIDHLRRTRESCTVADLQSIVSIKVPVDELKRRTDKLVVSDSDSVNPVFVYRPMIQHKYHQNIANFHQLKAFCLAHPRGVSYNVLADAYKEAGPDVDRLIADGTLVKIGKGEAAAVYPPFGGMEGEVLDEDLKELWNGVKMPATTGELENALIKLGHTPFDRRGAVSVTDVAQFKRKKMMSKPKLPPTKK